MVDVSAKAETMRVAVARGRVRASPAAMRLARSAALRKGSVAEVARLAGIMAAKRCGELIPLAHSLNSTPSTARTSAPAFPNSRPSRNQQAHQLAPGTAKE